MIAPPVVYTITKTLSSPESAEWLCLSAVTVGTALRTRQPSISFFLQYDCMFSSSIPK